MAHKLTLEIPDEAYEYLRKEAEEMKATPEEIASEWLEATIRRMANDPLLQLAGTLECDVTDVSERHDYYIGQALLEEMRGGDGG
jgi:hypothetical protein